MVADRAARDIIFFGGLSLGSLAGDFVGSRDGKGLDAGQD
jgi:hypothetical protein